MSTTEQTLPFTTMKAVNGPTPGPWEVITPHRAGRPGIEAESCSIIVIGDGDDEAGVAGRNQDGGEALANATLIAASPDMLAALALAIRVMSPPFDVDDKGVYATAYRAVEAAIAKATAP